MPELMAGTMRLREDPEEEVPRLTLEAVAKERRLPLDAGDQARPERIVVRQRPILRIARIDGVAAEAADQVVNKTRRPGRSLPAPGIMSSPVGDVDPIQAFDWSGERRVDYGYALSRSAQVGPERQHRKAVGVHSDFQVVRRALEVEMGEHSVARRRHAREKGRPDPAFKDAERRRDRGTESRFDQAGDRRKFSGRRPFPDKRTARGVHPEEN